MDFSKIFRYEETTGILFSIERGCAVGCKNTGGYLQVEYRGRKLLLHRIIWDLCNPTDKLGPGDEIDHIDHNPANNRIDNLRKVTTAENLKNKSKYKNNKSGVTGVHFESRRGLWVAKIRILGKNVHIGYFADKDAAVRARKDAEEYLKFHKNHGED